MSPRFTFLRHPLHPPFTHFPVALWSVSLIWDFIGLLRSEALWWQLSFWSIAAGLAFALPAAITGFIEYVTVAEERKDAIQTATRHMIVIAISASAYTGSLVFRGSASVPSGDRIPIALGFAVFGFICLQIGSWLGGELVFRHRVGVDDSKS